MLLLGAALISVAGAACNTLDKPGPKGSVTVIPVDDRPALLTAAPPVPISGGTLAISSDGVTAVAADPDRDRVSVVDLNGGSVQHIALSKGDEPGRVTLDGAGRAFVALRRGGAVAVIDLAAAQLIERVPVCAAPRGMAFDAAQGLLHVACMEGRLLSLRSPAVTAQQPMAAGTQIVKDRRVELDLRDVMLRGDQLWVSTFKRAELLQIEDSGAVRQRISPSMIVQPGPFVVGSGTSATADKTLQPHLAYRTVADGAGNVLMLHQAESDAEVAIDQHEDNSSQNSSPYGGAGGSCSGIVTPAFTTVDMTGRVTTSATMTGVLSVDMAFAPDDQLVAIVQAGSADSGAPLRETFFDSEGGDFALSDSAGPGFSGRSGAGSMVTLLDMRVPATGSDCTFGTTMFVTGQSTAVALRPRAVSSAATSWVVQSREPAQLTLLPLRNEFQSSEPRVIDLGGDSVRDSGHEIFHRDAGGGIACASCHAEGGEDGHVWHFTTLGARRTQALHVGLEGTAPFHWAGDESDMNNLMSDVFVGRMGGVHQSGERISALTNWLFALRPPAAPTITDDAAVERGHELFMSPEVGCASCHSGSKLTNNQTVNVGTGEALQVPSLRGIAYRAPFMHNGCASNLRGRFDVLCGGRSHGNTAELSAESIDDLVAYLQTL
ncbi:MAG TPA: cytochrome-c peroxidase [Polyangiales bacterium]|nr:cytochrome-c peroxidase [Polyangiales bacterium]